MVVIEFTICFYQATISANSGEFSTIADDARRHQDEGIGARDGTRCCWRPQASVLLLSLSRTDRDNVSVRATTEHSPCTATR